MIGDFSIFKIYENKSAKSREFVDYVGRVGAWVCGSNSCVDHVGL